MSKRREERPRYMSQHELEQLGRRAGAVLDATLAERNELPAVRQRLLAPSPRPRRRRRLLFAVVGAVAGFAAVFALLQLWPATSSHGGFRVAGRAGQLGRWLRTPPRGQLELRFTDRSVVELAGSSAVRVAQASRSQVRLLLERGEARVQVDPTTHRRWHIDAGPFEVQVTGTRFVVGWQADAQLFSLRMIDGRVVVRGPVVGRRVFSAGDDLTVAVERQQLHLRRPPVATASLQRPAPAAAPAAKLPPWAKGESAKGESARGEPGPTPSTAMPSTPPRRETRRGEARRGVARRGEGRRAPRPARPTVAASVASKVQLPTASPAAAGSSPVKSSPPTPSPAATSRPAAPPVGSITPPVASATPPVTPPPVTPPPSPDSQQRVLALARAGHYRQAKAMALRLGWQTLLAQVPAAELLLLADTARLAGDRSRAGSAANALRKRFPRTPEAASAAFRLGRLAFEVGDRVAAAKWFATCLRETREPALAEAAAGRRLEALLLSGRRSAAQQAARVYLRRFPRGPSVAMARRALGSGPLPSRR